MGAGQRRDHRNPRVAPWPSGSVPTWSASISRWARKAGVVLIEQLKEDQPHLTVVVLTGDVGGPRALECIASGASAFIPKSAQPDEILSAFDAAASGYTWLPVALIGEVLDAALHPPPPTRVGRAGRLLVRSRATTCSS